MGRKSLTRTLNLWMNGILVGRWSIAPGGVHQLYYAQSWLESIDARPLSLSLPLQPSNLCYKGELVENFFDNLLPDSDLIRQRIQRRFGTTSQQAFDLLTEIGRDCVGAVQLLPEGEDAASVRTIKSEQLTDSDIEGFLLRSTRNDLFRTGNPNDFRISIAGAQEKNAFTLYNGRWGRPDGTTPTTHIFKLPIGDIGFADMSTSVENEWLCMQIIKRYGIDTADCRIEQFGESKTLVVKRFDRRLSADGSWIMRLPQEDFCQATGTSPGLKYESDGGPGMKKITDILLQSSNSIEDRKTFFKVQILYWLLAAPDGHAKNFSIFIHRRGSYQLTPLYDIISAYPVLSEGRGLIHPGKLKMAMAVVGKNRHYHWQKIRRDHWLTTAAVVGISAETVQQIFDEIINSTPDVIEDVKSLIPSEFPEYVAESILSGLEAAVGRL